MKKIAFNFLIAIFLSICSHQDSLTAQTGQVPELVNVDGAIKIIGEQLQIIQDEITSIQQSGGTVEDRLLEKQELFTRVLYALQANPTQITTFHAVAQNVNLKLRKMDDEAYHDLINGNWDENMDALIRALKK